MLTSKTPNKRDSTAEYEAAGTRILSDYTVAEMRKSVARLRRALRSAFPPGNNAAPVPPGESGQD